MINARTGSVVMNQAVTLAACAVAHGSLSVTISTTPPVSQPAPFSRSGQTVVTEKADITITQQAGSLVQMAPGAKLADVVKALNSLGATPQDLLAILQAMKTAGALIGRARGDLMARRLAAAPACRRLGDGSSLSIAELRSAAARDPKAAITRDREAVRGALHAAADEEHARGDDELGHARQRRHQARHRAARHPVRGAR